MKTPSDYVSKYRTRLGKKRGEKSDENKVEENKLIVGDTVNDNINVSEEKPTANEVVAPPSPNTAYQVLADIQRL